MSKAAAKGPPDDDYQAVIRELPKRDVTRAEFRAAAERGGWMERSIELFLRPGGAVVRKHVPVNGEMLRVIDW